MPKHDDVPQKPKLALVKSGQPRQPSVLEVGIVCSFSCGSYRVLSPSGKTGLLFEDSEQFGPSKLHPRTCDLSEISPRLVWFWDWYDAWRKAGRPTVGEPMSSPIGPIYKAQLPLPTKDGASHV